jgi:hypothetical protein
MTGWALLASVFGVIFVAELPDKTALAALALATRHRPVPVLLGAASALTIQSAVAVGAGRLVSLLPSRPVHVASGLLFLVSAVLMWRRKEDDDEVADRDAPGFWRSTWLVFAVVFVAERRSRRAIRRRSSCSRGRRSRCGRSRPSRCSWETARASCSIRAGRRASRRSCSRWWGWR